MVKSNKLQSFKSYIFQNKNTFTKHENYPNLMKEISQTFFSSKLFHTTSINVLNTYFHILLNEKPYYKHLSKSKQIQLKKAFLFYIDFIKNQKDTRIIQIHSALAA